LVVVVVPDVVVVVNEHPQVTLTLVAPLTVAVKVTDWLTMRMSVAGVTATVTVFPVLPPPHPDRASGPKARTNNPMSFVTFPSFVTTFPPA